MRRVNDMLKLIPLDELKGGNTMNEIRPTAEMPDKKGSKGSIKLRRGTSGIIAAALAVAVGGGVLAYTMSGRGVSPAANVSESAMPIDSEAQVQADKNAEAIYSLINSNVMSLIEDGKLNEIKKGSFVRDMYAPYDDTTNVRVRNDPQNDGVPDEGTCFYCIDATYKVVFVQWRSPENVVGQYSVYDCERSKFGELPDTPDFVVIDSKTGDISQSKQAHAIYDVINRMLYDYAWGEYPTNQFSGLLPPGNCEMLDFDHPDSYADLIYRIKQYNTEGVELTGKVYFEYSLGNDLFFLEWQKAEGEPIEIWPYNAGITVSRLGEVPEDWHIDQFTNFTDTKAPLSIGCQKNELKTSTQNGYYHGVITERSNMPEVFEWYESFVKANYEPVPFDESKLKTIEDIKQIVKYDWLDLEQRERIYIRTSDMEGANIYVNGRYYNVEDISVLSLLDNEMPPQLYS